jgi:hypothetical protein
MRAPPPSHGGPCEVRESGTWGRAKSPVVVAWEYEGDNGENR